jgi:cell division protein FtsI (penicillin-binding protein 3)
MSEARMAGVARAVKVRAYMTAVLLTALLAGITYKAWALQVGEGDAYQARALRQHVHTVEVPAPRGAILDTRGRPLAVSADADSIYANPREVVDVTTTAETLAEILGVDAAVLEGRLSSRKAFAWVARHVKVEQAEAVRNANLKGIELTTEPRRWYPGRTSGGPLLGFAGIDGIGLDGIELKFDKKLTGEKARFAALRDARGKTALADGLVEAVPGATVQLTIDRNIQQIADAALAEGIAKNEAKHGVAIVLDVKTGAVLAMASWPTYDPNEPGDAVKAGARNRAVTDVFEIGSIMKIFTIAAAFELGVTRADEWWDTENGRWKCSFCRRAIKDTHHDKALTTAGIFKRSSNVGAVKIGLRVGKERLYAALKKYGFGARTGIELPHEEPGYIRNGTKWKDIELATISFGYGLTVTPLQVACALAAFGDRGRWHTPHLIASITDASGKVIYEPKVETRQIYSEETAATMLPIMASVFDPGVKTPEGRKDAGTASNVVIDGFAAGGKTATAHKLDPVTRRYADKTYVGSFAGLAPIADPRIAVVVIIDEPQGKDYYGGKIAGPVFATIVSETLRYLGVPGSTPPNAKLPPEEAPQPDEPEPLPLDPNEAPPTGVPDFRGMSIARALEVARQAGFQIEVDGSGRATSQERVGDNVVRVHFSDSPGIATGMEIGEAARSPGNVSP